MIRQIVAVDSRRGIAKDGVQPWKLPIDEKYFTDMTKAHGGRILMGRTTFEVIGQPLADRTNFVLSRHDQQFAGATTVHDWQQFAGQDADDIWVIGGAEIYQLTLADADELYITEIDADFKCDKFYPDYSGFKLLLRSEPVTENGVNYRFCLYSRQANSAN